MERLERWIRLTLAAAIVVMIAAPLAGAQMDQLQNQIKQRAAEELQKRTGTAAPGQTAPAPPQQQAVPPPTGVSDAEKILVWADPSTKTYYREGDPQYGKTDGGRCMMEKIAKKNGLSPAAGEKKD
jgi:hypothetical protein